MFSLIIKTLKIDRLSILLVFFAIMSFSGYAGQNLSNNSLSDSTKIKSKLEKFLNFNNSFINFYFRTLPNSALNSNRFSLISDHNLNKEQYKLNSDIQLYFDNNTNSTTSSNIINQYNQFLTDLNWNNSSNINHELLTHVNKIQKRELFHSIWRSNLVHVQNEKELIDNIRETTFEMMAEGYDNLTEDLLPFITMLMLEEKKYHYQYDRVIATKEGAKGIVTSVEMMKAMASLNNDIVAGVCRDIHDMGLRILRPMYTVYLDEKYPKANYNVDDYVFLHAWVTPSSQHVTLVAVDPENTRNYHELDWGRIYKKEDQEGIEIGKMVGTTIRLWQFNPEKNITGAVNLLKSQWGIYLDNSLLKKEEDWLINGIYNPQYSSSANYALTAGKKSEFGISVAMLNAGEKLLSFNYRSGKHNLQLTKLFQYSGFLGFQAMFIEDTQRKSNTLPWAEWNSSVNFLNSVRYISKLKTTPIQILPGLKTNLYALSQLEVVWSMTHFKSNNEDFNNGIQSTGDGNIWLTWGAEINYQTSQIEFDIKYGNRNFLIPTDVRLLSPNPFELIRNATISNSGSGILVNAKFKNKGWLIEPEFRYEENKLNARFLLYSLKIGKTFKGETQLYAQSGSFNQIQGLEYYWYAKTRLWFDLGFESYKNQFSFSLHSEAIFNDYLTFGLSFRKYLN